MTACCFFSALTALHCERRKELRTSMRSFVVAKLLEVFIEAVQKKDADNEYFLPHLSPTRQEVFLVST